MASSVGRRADSLPPATAISSVPAPAGNATPAKALATISVRALLSAWRQLQGPPVSALAAVVAVIIGLGSYFAGLQSANLQVAQLNSQLQQLEKSAPIAGPVFPVPAHTAEPATPVSSAPPGTTKTSDEEVLRDNIRSLQAQNSEYRTLLELRDAEQTAGRSLLTVLGVSHSSLLPMKATNPAVPLVAYLVSAPGGRLVFVASVLPAIEADHQYQLWFYRKDDATALRGPVFDLKQPVAIDLNQVLPAGVVSLEITVEPKGGSDVPSTQAIATSPLED